MKAVQSCSPSSADFIAMKKLIPLLKSYGFIDKDLLRMECVLAKCTLADKGQELGTINDVLIAVIPLNFPNLLKLLQLSLTIVVSMAGEFGESSMIRQTKTI